MAENNYGEHAPVLLDECLQYLLLDKSKNLNSYLDLTLGGAGHLNAFYNTGRVNRICGIDQDEEAINNFTISKHKYECRVTVHHSNFYNFLKANLETQQEKFDVILADLGVSSHQFDERERGFSYRFDALLDMRMDPQNNPLTAKQIVNEYSEEQLKTIIIEYGEEKFADRIVDRILRERKISAIETTKQLEEICFLCYPTALRHRRPHPATKTFQALRIEVNDELELLKKSLPLMLESLEEGGRLGIITFHSLEDRIVKHFFRDSYKNNQVSYRLVNKRALAANYQEVKKNKRSRSAKLRVIEKKVLE